MIPWEWYPTNSALKSSLTVHWVHVVLIQHPSAVFTKMQTRCHQCIKDPILRYLIRMIMNGWGNGDEPDKTWCLLALYKWPSIRIWCAHAPATISGRHWQCAVGQISHVGLHNATVMMRIMFCRTWTWVAQWWNDTLNSLQLGLSIEEAMHRKSWIGYPLTHLNRVILQ